jgi:hypothetical protein
LKKYLPEVIDGMSLCPGFPEKPFSNPTKFRAAAKALQHNKTCQLVSVEGNFDTHRQALERNRDLLLFTFLRDPHFHIVSEWRHDIAKGKFATIEEKYAGREGQETIGFDHNLQVNRLAHNKLGLAYKRLEKIEFGCKFCCGSCGSCCFSIHCFCALQ